MVFKRKFLILGTVALITGLGSLFTFSQVPVFEASASVIVDSEAPSVLGGKVHEVVNTAPKDAYTKRFYMSTQIEILTSIRVTEKVVRKLNLHKNKKFLPPGKKKEGTRILSDVKRASARLRDSISAGVQQNSDILKISIRHSDPALAAQIVNTLVSTFIEQNLEYKLSSTTGAVKWLTKQLDDLKLQLDQADLALYKFNKDFNLVALPQEDRQSVTSGSLRKINEALIDIRLKRMDLAARQKEFQAVLKDWDKDPFNMAWDDVMSNVTIQQLKESVIEELRKLSALKQRYGKLHPQYLRQKATLEEGQNYLRREVNNVLGVMQSKYKKIRDHERLLTGAMQRAKALAQETQQKEVEYQRLKRAKDNTASLYQFVLTRMKESGLSAQLKVNNIRSLDAATIPVKPVHPRVWLNMLVSLFFGIVLGLGMALLVDTMDSSIKSQDDLNEINGVVFLGSIPHMLQKDMGGSGKGDPDLRQELQMHRKIHSDVAEACRAIRTNILFAAADRNLKTLVVTSPGPQEGKTSSAVSLAIAMAQAGSRTLLIDTDMRRPRLHRIFSVSGQEGITAMLAGDDNKDLDDLIKDTEVPNLFLLPCGQIPPNPAELCQSERFTQLRDRLSERFDRLVYDTPPVLMVTDAVVMSTLVDGTVLVARTGETSRESLRETSRQILEVKSKLFGCVLNDVSPDAARYYSKSKYYRRYKYKYGYYRGESEDGKA